MPKQRVRFYIDPEIDRDLVDFLESVPQQKRSKAIRSLLRHGLRAMRIDELQESLRAIIREELRAARLVVAEAAPANQGPRIEDNETQQLIDGLISSWEEK